MRRVLKVGAVNQKGGVGKTTTTLNIARAAHNRGLRTLIVDLDSQANTTQTLLGREPDKEGEVTIADVLSGRVPTTLAEVVQSTGWSNVDVVPSGGDILGDIESELVVMPTGREYRLREAFDVFLASPAGADYDIVLVDMPPSLSQLVINGLSFVDVVLIVTEASLYSANGIARLLRTIESVRKYNNPDLRIAGTIVNAFEARTRRQKHWLDELKAAGLTEAATAADGTGTPAATASIGPAEVWEPVVPKATWIAEAQEAGVGLDEWGTVQARVLQQDVYDVYLTRLLALGVPAAQQ